MRQRSSGGRRGRGGGNCGGTPEQHLRILPHCCWMFDLCVTLLRRSGAGKGRQAAEHAIAARRRSLELKDPTCKAVAITFRAAHARG